MFKQQLKEKKEYWPNTLQRENEGIYLRITGGPYTYKAKCSKGHILVPIISLTGYCDVCNVSVKRGTHLFDCQPCNYYMCKSCYLKENTKIKTVATMKSHGSGGAANKCTDDFCFLCNPCSKNKEAYCKDKEFRFSWGTQTILFGSDAFQCDVVLNKDEKIAAKHVELQFVTGVDREPDK